MSMQMVLAEIEENQRFFNNERKSDIEKNVEFQVERLTFLNFEDVKESVKKFWNLMLALNRSDSVHSFEHLTRARRELTFCRNILFNKIDPMNNDYIKEEYYRWLIDNLGRIDAQLDQNEHVIASEISIGSDQTLSQYGKHAISLGIKVSVYKRIMIESMYHLVLYPLRNALIKIINSSPRIEKEVKGVKTFDIIKKDNKLLFYFYFLELYQSSMLAGSLTKQLMSGKAYKGVAQTDPMGSPKASNSPSALPENIATVDRESELAEAFKEPDTFKELEEFDAS